MVFNFGEWITRVAVNGVIAGSFSREWASIQLANYYVAQKITDADLIAFDEMLDAYEEAHEQQTEDSTEEISE